jgi:hypothetical protein
MRMLCKPTEVGIYKLPGRFYDRGIRTVDSSYGDPLRIS